MTWRQALALAAVLGVTVFVTPAHADSELPPPALDIGGATEADALANYAARFGNDGPPLISVPIGQAKAECDRISMERFHLPYPEGTEWNRLLGCMIRNMDKTEPVIVYSVDQWRPGLAAQLIRHEAAHLLGWPGDHPR